MLKKLSSTLLLFLLASCASSLRESPMIYISNSSLKPIKNINCEWAKKHVMTLPVLNPGETRSQSFYIENDAEFFGLVSVSWTNDDGKNIAREFFFRKTNLPSIEDHTTYNYVQLYFDQQYVEITTSDAPDLSGKTTKMDSLLLLYQDLYAKGHKEENMNLINVLPPKYNSSSNFPFNY
ncbi:MAG: hypothetical protein KGP29_02175 [Proteobacteria bacterium]|nr:hypothetical protein [Pseudomonadota bacterium]